MLCVSERDKSARPEPVEGRNETIFVFGGWFMESFPMTDEFRTNLEEAAQLVLGSRHLVALVGAGLSVESGIPAFRGPDGLWTSYGAPSRLSYREFLRDPRLWWETRLKDEAEPGNPVHEMKLATDQAVPNAGHYALVALEQMGILKHVITQNVDSLHHRAGSLAITEIHGNRTWLRCISCSVRRRRDGFALEELPPRCPECGGILKLDTVMFGEPIPRESIQACRQQVKQCDSMILIGTSGVVNPAAQLPVLARERGVGLVEVNPHSTALTGICDLVLVGPAGETLPRLVDCVRQRRDPP